MQTNTLPGVLLGVFDELRDTLADFPGDKPLRADVFDELAFLCHLAMGAFVIGMSSFKMLWMSFSNPNCAILSTFSKTWTSQQINSKSVSDLKRYKGLLTAMMLSLMLG